MPIGEHRHERAKRQDRRLGRPRDLRYTSGRMAGVRKFLSVLVAIAAILFASGWTSVAGACEIAPAMEMTTAASAAMPMTMSGHHQQHHMAARHEAPGPAQPRLDCAACMAVLPPLPSVGRQQLMPFVPVEQTLQPLSGTDPAPDPPPPRAA